MTNAFISYSTRNSMIASHLGTLLSPFGYSVFLRDDAASISHGDIAEEIILDAIRSSDVVLGLLDEGSRNVDFELGFAFGLGKQVVLVTTSDTVVPPFLSRVCIVRVEELTKRVLPQILAAMPASLVEGKTKTSAQREAVSLDEWHYGVSVDEWRKANADFHKDISDVDWHRECEAFAYSNKFVKFEEKIVTWFKSIGTDVVQSDDSVLFYPDMLGTDPTTGRRYLVEIKNYITNHLVDVEEVRNFVRVVSDAKLNAGIMITSSAFTNSARDYVRRAHIPIFLWRSRNITDWREDFTNSYDRIMKDIYVDYSFADDPKAVDDFAIEYTDSPASFPDWLEIEYGVMIEKIIEKAMAENRIIYNDGTYSLAGISIDRPESRTGALPLIYRLHLRPSEYFRFVFPNTCLDAKLVGPDRDGQISYREKIGIDRAMLRIDNFHLWNIHYRVATNLILLTRDNFVIAPMRSEKQYVAPDGIHASVAAGMYRCVAPSKMW